ncbi:Ig-like domain-containing protein [Candidatus Gottesmanbacteria bacterium]|nr:Ig-like domain-containing protein [Candidatus Gottesmanbacteria bacterium]
MKDRKFLALTSFFFLLFFAGIATVALQKPTNQILRAKNVNPSPLKSFIIVFPQIGVAGDEGSDKKPTQIKVSVFIRDEGGSVLPGRSVQLATTPTSSIKPADTVSTDNLGMAQFFITSNTAGTVKLTATDLGSNTSVSNSPTVEFTQ